MLFVRFIYAIASNLIHFFASSLSVSIVYSGSSICEDAAVSLWLGQ